MLRITSICTVLLACVACSTARPRPRETVEIRIVPAGARWDVTYVDACGHCATVSGDVLAEALGPVPPGWTWRPGWRRCEWRPEYRLWLVGDGRTTTWRPVLNARGM